MFGDKKYMEGIILCPDCGQFHPMGKDCSNPRTENTEIVVEETPVVLGSEPIVPNMPEPAPFITVDEDEPAVAPTEEYNIGLDELTEPVDEVQTLVDSAVEDGGFSHEEHEAITEKLQEIKKPRSKKK